MGLDQKFTCGPQASLALKLSITGLLPAKKKKEWPLTSQGTGWPQAECEIVYATLKKEKRRQMKFL